MWTLQHVNRGRCRLQQLHNSCYFCMLGKLVMEGQVSAADTSFPCIWHCLEAFCGPKPKAYKAVKRKITLWVGYLWDSPSGRGAQRNMSWNDKGIRLCFPRLTPSSSVCGPRSLMESPAALKVQWWSFQCGVSSRRRVCVLCACVLPPQQDLQLSPGFVSACPAQSPELLWHHPHLSHGFLASWQPVPVSIPAAGTPWRHATNPAPPTHFPLAALAALMGNIAAHPCSQTHFRDDSSLTLLFVNTAAHCSGPQRLLPQISRSTRHQGEWVTQRWRGFQPWTDMNKTKHLLDASFLVDQCSQQLSTAQVKKEQASRPNKRGCFLTETELRLSRYILIFSFCGYWQSFFAWSH